VNVNIDPFDSARRLCGLACALRSKHGEAAKPQPQYYCEPYVLHRDSLALQSHEGKDFGRFKDTVDRDEIVVGVLKANIPGAVVDGLDSPHVE